jgi:hypothetical protein
MPTQPFEVVAQPFSLYTAPLGTAFPAIDEEPSGEWTLVGTSGDLNYDESGVKVQHKQKVEEWKALGSTGPRKAFRTEEEFMFSLHLVDISLEQYSLAMGGGTVATVPPGVGTAGYKSLGMSRGLEVVQYALLVRGVGASPYGVGNVQFEVPRAIQVGDPAPTFVKGKPAGLELSFHALEDLAATSDDERFGRLIAETAEANT